HLDFKHIDWLKDKLNEFPGAMIIVSHDREFLSTMCNEIWEVADKKIKVFAGGYQTYIEEKEKLKRHHDLEYEKYEKKKRQLQEAIKAKEEKATRATKAPTRKSASETGQIGAKPYYANKQKKLRKTASALETRLEQLEKEKLKRHHDLEYEKYEKKKRQLQEAIKAKEEKATRATKAPTRKSASETGQIGAKPYYANKQKKLRKTASALETRLEQLEKV